MDTKEAILNRRSIRKFSQKEISKQDIHELLEAGCAAPSACNKKPYQIYVITNKDKLLELDKCGLFTRMHSPLIIVVAGVLSKALPLKLKEYWIQDVSAVTENILIRASSLGLGTCWNGIYPQEKVLKNVRKALNLDENIVPLSLIHVGYKEEEKSSYKGYDKNKILFIE